MPNKINVQQLLQFSVQCLRRAGLDEEDAVTVADVLVTTDTWGTFSHGTGALPNYVRSLQAGGMDARAKSEIKAEAESWAVLDAHGGMGIPACCRAMNLAIQKAQTRTISWVGVCDSNHFGAAGYYATLAARAKMIGISMSSADPNMTIPGSIGHTIGNNPIAYAIPSGDGNPIFLDIALSAVAWGKIMSMKKQGQSIPSNWITDADGMPTTNLDNWPATGSMMPMASHKGYGIAVLVEALAGLLTGAGVLDEMTSWIGSPKKSACLGQAFLVINVADILPLEVFTQRARQLVQKIHESPKARGTQQIFLPGEMEWQNRADSLENGIALPNVIVTSLTAIGRELGVETNLFA